MFVLAAGIPYPFRAGIKAAKRTPPEG